MIQGATGDYNEIILGIKGFASEYDPHGMLTAFLLTMFAIAVLVQIIKRLPSAWGWVRNCTRQWTEGRKMRRELEVKVEDELSDAIETRIQIMIDDGLINPTQGNVLRKRTGKKLGYKSLIPVKNVVMGIRTRLSRLSWSKAPLPDAQIPAPLPSAVVSGPRFGSK